MSEPNAKDPPAKDPPAKVPSAVAIVGLVGLGALGMSAVYGGLLLFSLWQHGGLDLGRITWVSGGDLTPLATQLLVGAYYLLAAVVMAVILLGFVRLRRWAWSGLMLWCGLNLVVGLARLLEYGGQPQLYTTLFTSALVVLILNLEVIQSTFGLRRAVQEPPIRNDDL